LTYARQPLNVVWGFIIDDLKEAVRYCPESNDPQRATVYAANMLLGYAYMAAPEETGLRDFEEAAKCFKAIIDSQKFRLVEYYD
ncbi:RagB/SusD family nutrient uptake outer membrane protein, partial [Klebsiella oxytoca]